MVDPRKTDIPNGLSLGTCKNWDNDLCDKVVDQEYTLRISREFPIPSEIAGISSHLSGLGFGIKTSCRMVAEREYASPLLCLCAVERLEEEGHELLIIERRFNQSSAAYYRQIEKEKLIKILKGEVDPAYRKVPRTNPICDIKCDIGD